MSHAAIASPFHWLVGGAALVLVVRGSPALASEPHPDLSDLPGYEAPVTDLAPQPLRPIANGKDGPRLSVALSTRKQHGRRDYAGSLVVSIPTSRFATRQTPEARANAKADTSGEDHAKAKETVAAEDDMTGSRQRPLRMHRARAAFRITPADARAALSAYTRASGGMLSTERVDDLDARARWSALLPELRVRATRLVDEATSLSPTSYDAERTTHRGGASLWLEGRASWRLDRLVFASEEVRIERLRQDLYAQQQRHRRRVLELLFGWQRAALMARDVTRTPTQCVGAWLDEQRLEAELDIATGGWFSRWKKQRRLPEVDCESFVEPPPTAVDDE